MGNVKGTPPRLRLLMRIDGEVNTYLELGRKSPQSQVTQAFGTWVPERDVAQWVDKINQDESTQILKQFVESDGKLDVMAIEEGKQQWEKYFIVRKDGEPKLFETREIAERGIVITRKRGRKR